MNFSTKASGSPRICSTSGHPARHQSTVAQMIQIAITCWSFSVVSLSLRSQKIRLPPVGRFPQSPQAKTLNRESGEFMMQIKRKKLPAALMTALGAGVLLAATSAGAQQAQRVEKIEVTGTNIKRTDVETPSVVQVITREQIERSGATSVAELLREVPAIAGGSAQDFDGGTGFQRGNQTASLRGLGSVATLVLLNGRRIAPAPYADPNLGQGSSYNLNTIPISAIERIDVLKDGASAIYGSDAIAGVINIILRKDYRGAEIAWSHWQKLD